MTARREPRFAFEWSRPRLGVYRAAPPTRWRLTLNRYAGVVIGAAVQLGSVVRQMGDETGDYGPLEYWREIERSIRAPMRAWVKGVTTDGQ